MRANDPPESKRVALIPKAKVFQTVKEDGLERGCRLTRLTQPNRRAMLGLPRRKQLEAAGQSAHEIADFPEVSSRPRLDMARVNTGLYSSPSTNPCVCMGPGRPSGHGDSWKSVECQPAQDLSYPGRLTCRGLGGGAT